MRASTTLPYRRDIQGLRAIAILLVVLAHAEIPPFSGGFIGVDVFFVLSGYLITGLLVREYENSGTIQFIDFYARRLKRLLPTLLTVITTTALIAPILLSMHEVNEQSGSLVYAATWTSNLFFALSNRDYFSELQARDLFLHTWSLGVEEQFYLVWPILLLLSLKSFTRQWGGASCQKPLLAVLGLLFVLSLGVSVYWTTTRNLWSFYLMPSRIWQFSLGAGVLACLNGRSTNRQASEVPVRMWRLGGGFAGLILIMVCGVLLHPRLTYPGFWALLPSLGAALIIAAGHGSTAEGVARALSHPALVWIGDRSYSWYLWHWPVLMLGFAWGMQHRLAEALALVALSLLLATLSYRLVEQPFWRGGLSHAPPLRIVLASILGMLIVAAGALNHFHQPVSVQVSAPRPVSVTNAARFDFPSLYTQGCDTWYMSKDVSPCMVGDPSAPHTAVLLGDSVGAQWYSALPEIFRAPEWRIVVLTKSACAMVDESYYYGRIGRIYDVCTEWRNDVLDYLDSLRPSVVLLGSAATYEFSEEQWTDGSARVLARLSANAEKVIVLAGTPQLSFDGPGCIDRHIPKEGGPPVTDASVCREALTNSQSADVARYLGQAVQRFPNTRLLDLNDLVCPGRECAAQSSDGQVVFRDSQHLTASFVRMRAPEIMERLSRLGLDSLLAQR